MPLTLPDGERFATGGTSYQYRPATADETTPRIILAADIEGLQTEAVVDTGGVYLFCHPSIARRLALTPVEALSDVQTILFRGVLVHGRLYRLTLTLLAEEGEVGTKICPPTCSERCPSAPGSSGSDAWVWRCCYRYGAMPPARVRPRAAAGNGPG